MAERSRRIITVAIGVALVVLGWKSDGASPRPQQHGGSGDDGSEHSRSTRIGAFALALLTCAAVVVGLVGWGLWSTDRGVARRPQPEGSLLLLLSDPAVEAGVTVYVGEAAEDHPLLTIRLDIEHPGGDVLVDDDRPFRSVQWALLASGDFAYQPSCVEERLGLSTPDAECDLAFGSDPPVQFRRLLVPRQATFARLM